MFNIRLWLTEPIFIAEKPNFYNIKTTVKVLVLLPEKENHGTLKKKKVLMVEFNSKTKDFKKGT